MEGIRIQLLGLGFVIASAGIYSYEGGGIGAGLIMTIGSIILVIGYFTD